MGGMSLTRENALVFVARDPRAGRYGAAGSVPVRPTRRARASRLCHHFLAGLAIVLLPGGGPELRRRRRLLPDDLAVRSELLHRQQPAGRRHLHVAAIRSRRAGVRTHRRHRTRRARARTNTDACRGVELLDRSRARLRHGPAGRVAEARRPQGAAARSTPPKCWTPRRRRAMPSGRGRCASADGSATSACSCRSRSSASRSPGARGRDSRCST